MKTVRIYSIWTKRDKNDLLPSYEVEVASNLKQPFPQDLMEVAYRQTNSDDRPFGRRVCSTTNGDVMSINGQFWLVESTGFHELTPIEFEKICALTSRDTSMGYDWLKKNNLI